MSFPWSTGNPLDKANQHNDRQAHCNAILFCASCFIMLFYTIYSGIMMTELSKLQNACPLTDNQVNVGLKWFAMSQLCFATSLVMTIANACGCFVTCCQTNYCCIYGCLCANLCVGIAFIANFFLIPLTIFAKWS